MKVKAGFLSCFMVLIYFLSIHLHAQELDLEKSTFYFPHSLGVNKAIHMVGLSTAKLPEDVVETDDIIRAPLFSYDIKYGLPINIVLNGSINTNIVSFHFSVGSSWNYNISRLGLSAGTDIAFWYGRLKQFGFNTSYTGWILYPNVSIGYRFNKFSLSLKSELVLNITETSKNGSIKVSDNSEFFNGFTIGMYLEQPLWKDNYVVLGIRSNYLIFYYPTWAAFSTFARRFFIPEFTFRFIL